MKYSIQCSTFMGFDSFGSISFNLWNAVSIGDRVQYNERHVLLPAFQHPIIFKYHFAPAKRHRCRLFVQSRGRRVYASDKIMVGTIRRQGEVTERVDFVAATWGFE